MSYEMIPSSPGYIWGRGATEARGTALVSLPGAQKHSPEEAIVTRIALQNTAPGAGAMRVAVLVYDQNDLLDYECVSLHGNQVTYYDVNERSWLSPGFKGSLVISATYWERPAGVTESIPVGLVAVLAEQSQVSNPTLRVDQAWAVTGIALPPTLGLFPLSQAFCVHPRQRRQLHSG
jgi:hypothetical protein